VTRPFTIHDDNVEALTCQALGNQRSGNPGAHNQRIAFDALADFTPGRVFCCRKPRRTAAAQIGMFGIFSI
jgi:hypothetical protein